MNLHTAHLFALENGLKITRQGLYSAALANGFVSYSDNGGMHYDKAGLLEYIQYKTDTHPEFFILDFKLYRISQVSVLAALLKAHIAIKRYSTNYVINRKDKKNVEIELLRFKKNS